MRSKTIDYRLRQYRRGEGALPDRQSPRRRAADRQGLRTRRGHHGRAGRDGDRTTARSSPCPPTRSMPWSTRPARATSSRPGFLLAHARGRDLTHRATGGMPRGERSDLAHRRPAGPRSRADGARAAARDLDPPQRHLFDGVVAALLEISVARLRVGRMLSRRFGRLMLSHA